MSESIRRPFYILPTIVLAQFAGSSLWFAGNAVVGDLQRELGLGEGSVGLVTSSVQLGFIVGTLVFAILNVADRLPPRLVFLASALVGAALNAAVGFGATSMTAVITLRFLVGVCLAGIYPVGMKIAASWYDRGLGHALGLLVGALVLGTAFPHLLRASSQHLDWRLVLYGVSSIAAAGGALLFVLVPSGPHLPQKSTFDPRALGEVFKDEKFRAAAFGYFGHMWELYAFWAFVPVLLVELGRHHGEGGYGPAWSFLVIASGMVGCVVGGLLSSRLGSARVATWQIAISGVCCALSPLLFSLPMSLALVALFVWGITVVGDSPQFSALTALTAPRERVGTALTIVTSIGFFITIPSIQLLTWLVGEVGPKLAFVALVPGPLLGWRSVRKLRPPAKG